MIPGVQNIGWADHQLRLGLCSITRLFSNEFQCDVQRLHEFVDLDWFGKVTKESCPQAFLDIAWHCVGAEGAPTGRDKGSNDAKRTEEVGHNFAAFKHIKLRNRSSDREQHSMSCG